jgi:hypothetical protein
MLSIESIETDLRQAYIKQFYLKAVLGALNNVKVFSSQGFQANFPLY